jgi:hypothetical protein
MAKHSLQQHGIQSCPGFGPHTGAVLSWQLERLGDLMLLPSLPPATSVQMRAVLNQGPSTVDALWISWAKAMPDTAMLIQPYVPLLMKHNPVQTNPKRPPPVSAAVAADGGSAGPSEDTAAALGGETVELTVAEEEGSVDDHSLRALLLQPSNVLTSVEVQQLEVPPFCTAHPSDTRPLFFSLLFSLLCQGTTAPRGARLPLGAPLLTAEGRGRLGDALPEDVSLW